MPVVRYFLWVGSVLLAMIFIVGWVWPSADPAPVKEASASAEMPTSPANSMMLRIQSARKWPDKIEFDTSVPTIVPPPAPSVLAAVVPAAVPVAAASPLDARAEMKQVTPAPPPKRQARVHRRSVRPTVSTWAYANPAAQPHWSSWSNSPHWSWNW